MAMPSYSPTILMRSSFFRSVMTSASTPRSLKIATAAGDSLSAMRTLGIGSAFHLLPRPVEPGRKRFDLCGFNGGAAPDSEARRCVPVAGDVEGHGLGLEYRSELLHGVVARVLAKRGEA